jgi:hypothetical protein
MLEARVIDYADDGYIKTKLNVELQVLVELKYALKQDADLELNVSKTSILPKGVTAQATVRRSVSNRRKERLKRQETLRYRYRRLGLFFWTCEL